MDKKCTKCKIVKSSDEFGRMSKSPDGFKYQCRECCRKAKRAWEKTPYGRESTNRRLRKSQRKVKLWLLQEVGQKCCKCPEDHPACLDFHHEGDDKNFNVALGRAEGRTREELLIEAKKCVVMCANCHRKHHYKD